MEARTREHAPLLIHTCVRHNGRESARKTVLCNYCDVLIEFPILANVLFSEF